MRGSANNRSNKRLSLSMRDCSTCRVSRQLITRTPRTTNSFLFPPPLPPPSLETGERGDTVVLAEGLKPERRRARDQRPLFSSQDQSFLDSCAAAGIVSAEEIKAALCFVVGTREDRSPAQTAPRRVWINCERINAPFGNDDSLFARAFAFTRTLRAPASSSRGRDCGRNQLAGNAGLFRLTRFVGRLGTIILNLSRGKKCHCRVE